MLRAGPDDALQLHGEYDPLAGEFVIDKTQPQPSTVRTDDVAIYQQAGEKLACMQNAVSGLHGEARGGSLSGISEGGTVDIPDIHVRLS